MYLVILLCIVLLIYFTRKREGLSPSRFLKRLPPWHPFRIRMERIRQRRARQRRAKQERERLEKLALEARLKRERDERMDILISKEKITL